MRDCISGARRPQAISPRTVAGARAKRMQGGYEAGRGLGHDSVKQVIHFEVEVSTMKGTVSLTPILSRVVAVLFLAVPFVLITQALDNYEQEMIAKLSYQELLAYLRDGQTDSFAMRFLTLGGLSLIYLLFVELISAFVRMWVRLLSPQRAPEPIPVDVA